MIEHNDLHRIKYGEDEHQFGDLRLPDGNGPHPVAIVIHGGFWRAHYHLDLMDAFAEDLTNRGIATWNIEYRRVGQVEWPGTLTDVAQATDFLQPLAESYPLDLTRVMTIGHSAGGHLALWTAARHKLPEESSLRTSNEPLPLKGAISLAGVSDLALMQEVHSIPEIKYGDKNNPTQDLLGGTPTKVPERYAEGSPIELLPIGVPMVLIHGALDVDVPIGMSTHFEKAAKAAGDDVTLIDLPTAEHFNIIDPGSAEWSVIVRETLKMLSK